VNKSILLLSLFLISFPSYAYLGPGMGGGAIAAIIGFFAAILLGLWGILYYPIKRSLKKRKEKKMSLKESENEPENESE
jgi:Na+-driven multidrug efflux pump